MKEAEHECEGNVFFTNLLSEVHLFLSLCFESVFPLAT